MEGVVEGPPVVRGGRGGHHPAHHLRHLLEVEEDVPGQVDLAHRLVLHLEYQDNHDFGLLWIMTTTGFPKNVASFFFVENILSNPMLIVNSKLITFRF